MSPETLARALLRRRIAAVEVDDETDGGYHMKAIVLDNGVRVEFRGEQGFASHAVCTLVARDAQGTV